MQVKKNICSLVKVKNQLFGIVGRMFTNGLGDWGSIPGQAIPLKNGTWYLFG